MANCTYQDILNHITMPSQYLGSEVNAVKKDFRKTLLKMALAFPDLYEIGTSHFGIQILYGILNAHPDILAERVFCPAVDMQHRLEEKKIPLLSLESQKPLKCFDIIGFSLLYELNYTNILTILKLSQIPFLARQRDESHPLIIAGGPCACNPEPVAGIFDAIVFGDGEEVCMQMAQKFMECRQNGMGKKDEILKQWSYIEGVYIPSFFEDQNVKNGDWHTIIPRPCFENRRSVTKALVADINRAPFAENPVVPFGKPVHDRLRMEIARGCSRGCRFCQAGMIYRPVRERNCDTIVHLLEKCIQSTGYEDISLMSLSTGDYSEISRLLENLMRRYQKKHIAVSLPSFRAGTLTSSLMEQIRKVRKTGFTIAPEAGSQRLRNVINKNINEDQIYKTVYDAVKLGWKTIKLYFMIGLPTETEDDLSQTIQFIKNIRKIKGLEKNRFNINASFTTFIPKPHTPFQWADQIPLEYSKEIIYRIQKEFKGKGVQIKWQQPETSQIEGLFARGDRQLTNLLIHAFEKGCRLDGWSDHFDYDKWIASARETGIDPEFYTTRKRNLNEPLPWDHMNCRVDKRFFKQEWSKAVDGKLTPDCRDGKCQKCGVCDFQTTQPVFSLSRASVDNKNDVIQVTEEKQIKKIRVAYSKTGNAKYFGHLEMVNIFLRAIRRANISVNFSKGFHPMPKISFEDPLPLGMESLEEQFFMDVDKDVDHENIPQLLNSKLPEYLQILKCDLAEKKAKSPAIAQNTYTVELAQGVFAQKALENFLDSSEFNILRTNKKGKTRTVNLKNIIEMIRILDNNKLLLTISFEPGIKLRPPEIVKHIFCLSEENLCQAKIIKQSVCRKDKDVQTADY